MLCSQSNLIMIQITIFTLISIPIIVDNKTILIKSIIIQIFLTPSMIIFRMKLK